MDEEARTKRLECGCVVHHDKVIHVCVLHHDTRGRELLLEMRAQIVELETEVKGLDPDVCCQECSLVMDSTDGALCGSCARARTEKLEAEVERLRGLIEDVGVTCPDEDQTQVEINIQIMGYVKEALELAEPAKLRKGKYVHPCPHCGENIRAPQIENMTDAAGDDFVCPKCGKLVFFALASAEAGEGE